MHRPNEKLNRILVRPTFWNKIHSEAHLTGLDCQLRTEQLDWTEQTVTGVCQLNLASGIRESEDSLTAWYFHFKKHNDMIWRVIKSKFGQRKDRSVKGWEWILHQGSRVSRVRKEDGESRGCCVSFVKPHDGVDRKQLCQSHTHIHDHTCGIVHVSLTKTLFPDLDHSVLVYLLLFFSDVKTKGSWHMNIHLLL